jgi:hypothetical protein
VRRPTAIILIVLFALLVGAAIVQFAIFDAPDQPYPGPQSGTPLPPTAIATGSASVST